MERIIDQDFLPKLVGNQKLSRHQKYLKVRYIKTKILDRMNIWNYNIYLRSSSLFFINVFNYKIHFEFVNFVKIVIAKRN